MLLKLSIRVLTLPYWYVCEQAAFVFILLKMHPNILSDKVECCQKDFILSIPWRVSFGRAAVYVCVQVLQQIRRIQLIFMSINLFSIHSLQLQNRRQQKINWLLVLLLRLFLRHTCGTVWSVFLRAKRWSTWKTKGQQAEQMTRKIKRWQPEDLDAGLAHTNRFAQKDNSVSFQASNIHLPPLPSLIGQQKAYIFHLYIKR